MIDSTLAAESGTNGVVERLRLRFFRSFFALVLLAIAIAEWAILARIAARLGIDLPGWLHVAAPAAIWAGNRAILLTRGRTMRGLRLRRAYAGVAFTSVFAGVFLLLATLVGAAVAPAGAAVLAGVGMPFAGLAPGGAWQLFVDAGLATIAGLFLWGYTGGRRRVLVSRHAIAVRDLPPALDGFRIVHLSDLHIGEHLDVDELAAHVARVNALAPDLVCITGDLVDRAETCATAFPVLGRLRATHGVIATLGNHDHAAGAAAVASALRRHTNFTVLCDERTDVVVAGTTLAVLGLDDLGRDWARGVTEHPALPPLARGVAPGTTMLVLSHRPDCFPQAAAAGAALVLSGHTHGGQLGLPFLRRGRTRNLAEFITPYDHGLFEEDGSTLVVSRGLGFTAQPVRLFMPREIGCLELRAR